MANELRADAQFVLDCDVDDCDAVIFDGKDDVPAGEDFVSAAQRNARHILATTADDDGESLTPDWCAANGATSPRLTSTPRWEWRCRDCTLIWREGYAKLTVADGSEEYATDETVVSLEPTRGDVRRLLAALGCSPLTPPTAGR